MKRHYVLLAVGATALLATIFPSYGMLLVASLVGILMFACIVALAIILIAGLHRGIVALLHMGHRDDRPDTYPTLVRHI